MTKLYLHAVEGDCSATWKIISESVIDEIREREEDERRLYEKRA